MSDPKLEVLTGLSLRIAGVVLVAVLDDKTKTARIEQRGEPLNGEAAAIAAARQFLAERVRRTKPGWKVQ